MKISSIADHIQFSHLEFTKIASLQFLSSVPSVVTLYDVAAVAWADEKLIIQKKVLTHNFSFFSHSLNILNINT